MSIMFASFVRVECLLQLVLLAPQFTDKFNDSTTGHAHLQALTTLCVICNNASG